MDRKLKIVMIAIWSFIGIMLIGMLAFCIINNRGIGFHFAFNEEGLMTKVQKQEAIPLNDCNRIILDSSSADVIISSSDDSNLKVVESSSSNLNEDEKFTFEKQGSTVLINDRHVHIMFNLFGSLNKKIELFIPKDYDKDLELESLSGDITVNDELKLNNLRFKESSGDLNCIGKVTAGQIDLKTSSGDIKLADAAAKAYKIDSSSGDIRIDSLSGSGEISSSSGDVRINYGDINEYTDIRAYSGDIKLFVPSGLSFEFDGDCSSGDINSDFDLNYKNKNGNKATAKIGDGPYKKISVRTLSGDININQR